MINSLKANPFHVVIGSVQVAIGIYLIIHDSYFSWPPIVAGVANDDIVGATFVVLGCLMLAWVLDKRRSARENHIVLALSAGFMTALSLYQLVHVLILGVDMPWISNAALAAIIMLLARRSDSE
ncbi:MAG: hypothetical protein SOH70_03765 [Lentilactobacillus sunkii]|jgi:hypothetical protein|uniref:hypothetical protein n=1 Tax=Lentilactobacillus sunkii TaxID=481719 RepID=UPI002F35DAF5